MVAAVAAGFAWTAASDVGIRWTAGERGVAAYGGDPDDGPGVAEASDHAEELFGVLDYVDTANFARGLGAELLLGTALMDTAATPASQFAIVNQVPGPKRHLTYPKWGHERVNAFEDQLLQFLH